jgi:ribosomal protein S27AE
MNDIQLFAESWQGDGEVRSVVPSGQIVLECSRCGEHLILLGLEEDWPKEHRDAFGCSGCGDTVTLAHRVDGTTYTIKTLLRSSVRPLRPGA